MKIGGLKINNQPQRYSDAQVSIAELEATKKNCEDYEKSLAEDYGINISESDWKAKLKEAINIGYGKNDNKRGVKEILSTDEMYDVLIDENIDSIYSYLTGDYGKFGGASRLATKIEDDFKKLKGKDVSISIEMVKGDIDEYIASYLRSTQYSRTETINTERQTFPLKIKYDISQTNKDTKRTLKFENKKGISANYLQSYFHFGDYSTVETFMKDKSGEEIFKTLRSEVIRIIQDGRINIMNDSGDSGKIWRYKCETYIRLANAYISWRLSEGDILFTNSRGDINFGSEILDGFINEGKLNVFGYTGYTGRLKEKQLAEVDEKYIATWKQEAEARRAEVVDAVLNKIKNTTNKNLQVKIWYGK